MQGTYNAISIIIPNIITLFRVLLLPIIVFFLFKGDYISTAIGFSLFLVGSISDAFDGMIARKLKATSKFGFIVDPIADKVLVLGTLLTLSLLEYLNIPLIFVLIVFFRDIMVSILKPISDKLGFPIPTTFFAKSKTTLQFVGISVIMIYMIVVQTQIGGKVSFEVMNSRYNLVSYIPFSIVLLLTIVTVASGIEYIVMFVKGLMAKKKANNKQLD